MTRPAATSRVDPNPDVPGSRPKAVRFAVPPERPARPSMVAAASTHGLRRRIATGVLQQAVRV
ncbi:hypothetical protein [Streptomyces sp. NPDC059816]|uniref:hypothetical protein n=1 Tax=Streptomyces sp. NPDC059816 TaxID=3346960 RepID=UPI0036587A81